MGRRSTNYPPELRERAVRMVAEVRPGLPVGLARPSTRWPADWDRVSGDATQVGPVDPAAPQREIIDPEDLRRGADHGLGQGRDQPQQPPLIVFSSHRHDHGAALLTPRTSRNKITSAKRGPPPSSHHQVRLPYKRTICRFSGSPCR